MSASNFSRDKLASNLTKSTPLFWGWIIWSIAALFYAYEFLHRVSTSVMVPDLMSAFTVSKADLGWLSSYYFYAYAFFQIPAGVLFDRFGTRAILTLASLVVTLGSFLLTSAETLWIASLSRLLIGAGSAFAFVGCLKLASQWLSKSQFPVVVGLTNLSGMVGAIFGGKPLARMIMDLEWRNTMFIISCVGALITLALWMFIRSDHHHPPHQSSTSARSTALQDTIKQVFFSKLTWVLALYGTLLVAPVAAFAELWGVPYLQLARNVSEDTAAGFISFVFLGIAIGGPVVGYLSDKIKIYFLMPIATMMALITLLTILFAPPASSIVICGILFFYGFFTSNMLLCFTLVTHAHPKWASGTAIGLINTMVMAGGALFQPLVGKLIDIWQSAESNPLEFSLQSFQYSLLTLPICLIVALGLTLLIKRMHKETSTFTSITGNTRKDEKS